MDLSKVFVDRGIYKLNSVSDSIFLCEAIGANYIAKLVNYKQLLRDCWERTDTSYFITTYSENDIKSIFILRENYDMLGMIDNNFVFCDDRKYIKRLVK